MPGGAPGLNSRGRGGKFRKYTRGGGKQFSRDLQPVDAEGNQVSMWSEVQKSSEEESPSEEESEEENEAGPAGDAEVSREDRKAQKKARKEAAIAKSNAKTVEAGDLPSSNEESDDDMPANPNRSVAARKQTEKPATVDDITEGIKKLPGNRREREAAEAAAAKERYMMLSAQGKTDTAKADLARLKLIREQREIEAARRQAEKEEREEQEQKKRVEIEARDAKRRELAAGPKKTGKKK